MAGHVLVHYRTAAGAYQEVSPSTPLPVDLSTASGGGASTVFDADGDNTAQAAKTSAGSLYSLQVTNPNATDAYIQFFDVAVAGVTVGTTVPKQSFLIPAQGAFAESFSEPIAFATAITYACTTTATGSGDPTTGLTVNIIYA